MKRLMVQPVVQFISHNCELLASSVLVPTSYRDSVKSFIFHLSYVTAKTKGKIQDLNVFPYICTIFMEFQRFNFVYTIVMTLNVE